MGWMDQLAAFGAGALGGASQGLGQVQQERQTDIQNQLRQRQMQMDEEQRKRQAVFQARQLLEGGMAVPEDQLKSFAEFPEFMAGIVKDPTTGQAVVQKSAQQQLIDKQLAEIDQELAVKKAREAAREEAIAMGPEFFNLPMEQKLMFQNKIGDPKFDITTPAQDLVDNQKLEETKLRGQLQLAGAQARAYATLGAAQTRSNQQDRVTPQEAMGMLMAKKDKWGESIYDPNDPATVQMAIRLAEQLNQQGSQGALPTSQGPAVGEMRIIQGQKARWDGRGWVAAQ